VEPVLEWINGPSHSLGDRPEHTSARYTSAMPKKTNGERSPLEQELRLLYQAIAASSNGIVISDPRRSDNPLVYVNRSFELMTGYSAEEVLGRNCRFLQGSDGDQPVLNEVRAAIREERDCQVLLRNYRKDGTLFWNELRLSPVHDARGRLINFVGAQNDVTERKQAEEELQRAHDELEDRVRQRTARLAEANAELQREIAERRELEAQLTHQAFHDPLTGLPNRTLFLDRLDLALERAGGWGGEVAVLFMDLDDLTVVNDSLGHEVGDMVLLAVAERLENAMLAEETVARFGGDEFAVLLEKVEASSDAAMVAERILERFGEPLVMEGREIAIRPSIGIALGNALQNTAEELLRYADTAMYQAKRQDDDYRVFEPAMYEKASRRLKLENDMRRAIEGEEFVVWYQPIVDLQTGEVAVVEALVRWEHPEQQGLIAPSQFISVAEETGLVVPMGRWVLEEACRQGARWQQKHPRVPPLVVSVNLSAKQLQHPDVAETIEETLRVTGLDARYLSLDITETVYIEALKGHTAALNKIKRIGVRFSIDDFGTGYSSLAYLKRLPVDILKIDKSFIKGIGEDIEDKAIVQMIIELAHTLGMEVVAEGVESEEQAEQLKEMGCDRGQGIYFSKPLSPKEASRFLAR
jgi:diguanylate cyclase (GGDEF)-like protein/PAS domain S-box-containing protein